MRFYFLFVFFVLATIVSVAQPPPPASPSGSPRVTTIKSQPTLAKPDDSGPFSSVEGRFSIDLPKSISGFSALTPENLGQNASGGQFRWLLKEGTVLVNYFDYLDPNLSFKTEQDLVNFFAGFRDGLLASMKGVLRSEKRIRLDENHGLTLSFDLANGSRGIARVYLVERRNYSFVALTASDVSDSEKLVTQAFDSFALISQPKIDDDKSKAIEAATPASLPQQPVVPKERSDAQDNSLKGNVKNVQVEDQDLSGTWSTQSRHFFIYRRLR